LDGESGSQEQDRSQIFDTVEAPKGHGRREREGAFKVCGERPEEGKAQEGSGRVAV